MASSPMVARLAQQLERRHRLDNELLQQQRKLAQSAAEYQTMLSKEEALAGERAKLQTLREKLTEQREEMLAELNRREQEDKTQRTKLSDELTERIKQVNDRVVRENQEWTDAVAENQRLKEKISIVRESIDNGTGKFEELLATREKEFADMQEKKTALVKVNEDLRVRAEAAVKLIAERTPAFEQAKQQATEYNEKFSAIQSKIADANQHFTRAKTEQQRLLKRLNTAETERRTSLAALHRSIEERDRELDAEKKLQAQVKTLLQQTETLVSTLKILQDKLDNETAAAPAGE